MIGTGRDQHAADLAYDQGGGSWGNCNWGPPPPLRGYGETDFATFVSSLMPGHAEGVA